MKPVKIYKLEELSAPTNDQAEINGKWVPARPIGYYSWKYKLECLWLVFTGKCDLVKWPEGQ